LCETGPVGLVPLCLHQYNKCLKYLKQYSPAAATTRGFHGVPSTRGEVTGPVPVDPGRSPDVRMSYQRMGWAPAHPCCPQSRGEGVTWWRPRRGPDRVRGDSELAKPSSRKSMIPSSILHGIVSFLAGWAAAAVGYQVVTLWERNVLIIRDFVSTSARCDQSLWYCSQYATSHT
jgi:hypothetical protein